MTAKQDTRALKAVERAETPQDNTVTLSSGVVLRGKQANPLILIQVMAEYIRPTPPVYHSNEMGRDIENPDDPDYLERLQSWKMEYSNAVTTAMILLGTELVSKPKGMPGPRDDQWLQEYSLLAKETHPGNPSWRYLTWVKFVAMKDASDMQRIQEVVGKLSGVRESAVKAAEDFPGRDASGG